MKDNTKLLLAIAFAAEKHSFQKRKDEAGTPYINHPIQLALTLAQEGEAENETLLIAAILHDTIEDTETSPKEILQLFGNDVLQTVLEVTDNRQLPKQERKNLQVVNASKKSENARKLKLADKICNVNDIIHHPPDNWPIERKLEYLDWAEKILLQLKGTHQALENKLQNLIDEGREIFKASNTLVAD